MSFADCARAYIQVHQVGWTNALHARQWPTTLETYVYPTFGNLPVAAIDTALVMKVLEPIWGEKTETASRVRNRIEKVLDWARSREYRSGENPARWKGHLANMLAKPSAAKKTAREAAGRDEHHAALPYGEIGAFMMDLRQQDSVSARALEFTILTASRTGEVIGARWDEIDPTEKLWTVPAGRMKAGKEHKVPLSDAAFAVLAKMETIRASEFVFPGLAAGKPLSNMAMLQLLRRMGRKDLTVHGFRSSFRDWAAERTHFAREIAEMVLAHRVAGQTEGAYWRSDIVNKRRRLAAAWAEYCNTLPAERGKVVNLRSAVKTA
jgi:integrase